jgi:uncharacterized membrane-anchored protein YhcB (DUF1043 family)
MKLKTKLSFLLCGTVLGMVIGEIIAYFQIQSVLAVCSTSYPPCAMGIMWDGYLRLSYVTIGMVVGGISTCIIIFLIPPSQKEKEQKELEKRLLEKLKE